MHTPPVSSRSVATPDFYAYPWEPISGIRVEDDGVIVVSWPDGVEQACHVLWLLENAVRPGSIDDATRELTVDPAELPATAPAYSARIVDGALEVTWADSGITDRYHPGWLRHVADGLAETTAYLPTQEAWTAASFSEPPTHGPAALHDDDALLAWLEDLARFGIARLTDVPTSESSVADVARRIGAIRETNFGVIWWVRADVDPDSTANTGLRLAPHTDLPTRETPPGFQLLHCLENTATGGTSRMTDGLALTEHLRQHEPDTYEALTTLRWVFFNRSPDHDHRWTGPIIDHGGPDQPLTLRAFHPVRAFPAMEPSDVGRAYAALRRFSALAADPELSIGYPFRPGDLVAFDNRRILHGRDAYEPAAGTRVLRGCYIDHDEVYSRLRVLHRRSVTDPTKGAVRP